ncbi:MAG: hypothetical protein R3F39_03010 [Myxococcota bacterium]
MRLSRFAVLAVLCAFFVGCDSPGEESVTLSPDGFVQRFCVPGATQTCLCVGAVGGAQVCDDSGTKWLSCECATPTPDVVVDTTPTPDAAVDTTPTPDAVVDTTPTPDAVVPVTYHAVFIQDHWDGINCGSINPAKMSPGADIDAVELLSGTTILGYFDVVRGETNPTQNAKCDNGFNDPNAAKGAPDATKNYENYFSLYGGWLIGEFAGAAEIQPGDTIKVYELGQSHPLSTEGADEPYEVWIATGLDCVEDPEPQANCMVQLSTEVLGTATLSVPAF